MEVLVEMPGPLSTPKRRASARYALSVSHIRHSSHTARLARSAAARAAMMARFDTAADPTRRLLPAERQRRAALLRRSWFQWMNYCRSTGRQIGTLTAFLEKHAGQFAEGPRRGIEQGAIR